MLSQLLELFELLRRLGYVLLLIASSFLVQLHLCLSVADSLGIIDITSKGGFYPLYDWSQHAERFLICCGAFLWLGYILPNRKGISLWAQGKWSFRPPLWVAFLHIGAWFVIWGPLAHAYAVYEGMSVSGIFACLVVLAGMYYVQVWQDVVLRIQQVQRIRAQSTRFPRRTRPTSRAA